jgi:hypothetical protein
MPPRQPVITTVTVPTHPRLADKIRLGVEKRD